MHHPGSPDLARDDAILIGSSWYPELWPEAEWERDLERMRELGFRLVRVFEFAWRRCQPAADRHDFAWAVRVLDACHRHGIMACVGTPTAAPPAWLTSAHPDVLRVDADGRRHGHGGRKHASHISRTYRRLCVGIATRYAEAFSGHPALHSWQIDNELGAFDYGPEAQARFHAWLEARYGTVDELNRRWSLDLWSQAYDRFDQIPLVTGTIGSTEAPERHHPSLVQAGVAFQNEEWAAYVAAQCDAIRAVAARRGLPQKPITTNMVGSMAVDWFAVNRSLDRVGHSMYHDVEHYPWLVFRHDRMRAEKRGPDGRAAPFWLLETAPNWSGGGAVWNIHHDGGGVRAMTWLATALGATMACYWQWREHPAGQEMNHGTLVTATGAWRPNKAAMQRICAEHRRAESWLLAHPPAPAGIGLVLSYPSAWGLATDPIDQKFKYDVNFRDEVHAPLRRAHWWRDVIAPEADIARYRVLCLPWTAVIDDALRDRLGAYVRAGGRLILGPVAGYRTPEWTARTDRVFGGLEDLIGAECALRFTPMWMEDRLDVIFADGAVSRTRQWCEAFAPRADAEVVARYRYRDAREGYGDGMPAIVRSRCGDGSVLTLGCPVDQAAWLRLVAAEAQAAGLAPVATGDADVAVAPRAGADGRIAGWAVVNLAEQPRRIVLPAGGIDLLTGTPTGPEVSLDPAGVRIIAAV